MQTEEQVGTFPTTFPYAPPPLHYDAAPPILIPHRVPSHSQPTAVLLYLIRYLEESRQQDDLRRYQERQEAEQRSREDKECFVAMMQHPTLAMPALPATVSPATQPSTPPTMLPAHVSSPPVPLLTTLVCGRATVASVTLTSTAPSSPGLVHGIWTSSRSPETASDTCLLPPPLQQMDLLYHPPWDCLTLPSTWTGSHVPPKSKCKREFRPHCSPMATA